MARARNGQQFDEGDTVVIDADGGDVTGLVTELAGGQVTVEEAGSDEVYTVPIRSVQLVL
jgi:hypothetical protein